MNNIKILHNPRCTKSRETLCLLEEQGIKPEVTEYLKNTPSEKELKQILKMLGMKAEQIVRKKEPLFIAKFSKKKYSEAEWIKILLKNPILIERPVVVKGNNKAVIGRPPENVNKLL